MPGPFRREGAGRSVREIVDAPVLQQAVLRRGIPKRLYVDNGAVYRSHHLSLVCAKLGITLIHTRPYQPQAKGYASHCTSPAGFEADLRFRLADWIPFHA